MENRETQYRDLGRREYREVWALQEKLLEETKSRKLRGERSPNYLLLVEHDPVYTLGKSGKESNMLADSMQLRARHAELIRVDRGGDITFHGPGQWVVYPVIDLENFGMGVKEYVHGLEEVVIRTIGEYGIRGERLPGATGVWIDSRMPQARKICAIGVKCSRYVTMHGLALNVSTDLTYFQAIHPCGFVDKGVTSIVLETGQAVEMEDVKSRLLKHFAGVFGMQLSDGSGKEGI